MIARNALRAVGAAEAVLAVPVVYLTAMTGVAVARSLRRDQPARRSTPTTRFVMLVPAHNEESTIGALLASLHRQDYPNDLFAAHVVADNCTDATAERCREAAIEVHERHDDVSPGKGPALNWLLSRIVASGAEFDVAVFVDADTTVDPGFLAALDHRFAAGADVVQGFYGVRDAFASTPAALRYCALAARHHLRPLARTTIGGSCGLFGNGMAFRRELIVGRQWTAHLVEDMELQLELLAAGVHVEYEPGARVEAEMPHTLEASVTQHQRWEVGKLDLTRRYVPRLLRRAATGDGGSRLAAADAALDLAVPPLSLLGLMTVATTTAGLIGLVTRPRRRGPLFVGAALSAMVCTHMMVALRLVRAPRAAYMALLAAPKLALWKVGVLARSAFGPRNEWIRTRRNAEAAGDVSGGGEP